MRILLKTQIAHGYLTQVDAKRINKLTEDAAKDEFERIEAFKSALKLAYGGRKEEIDTFVNEFEGSLEECAVFYKLSKKIK